MVIRNELGFLSEEFKRTLDGSTNSRIAIAFSMLDSMFQIGTHGGMNKICVDYPALGVGIGRNWGNLSFYRGAVFCC